MDNLVPYSELERGEWFFFAGDSRPETDFNLKGPFCIYETHMIEGGGQFILWGAPSMVDTWGYWKLYPKTGEAKLVRRVDSPAKS